MTHNEKMDVTLKVVVESRGGVGIINFARMSIGEWPLLHSSTLERLAGLFCIRGPIPKLLSQHQLPVGNVNPSTVLEAYLAKRCDSLETELFMQGHTRLIRKSRSADRNVYASRPQER
jgi:hypothetical protein